jgi:hypothetical protein
MDTPDQLGPGWWVRLNGDPMDLEALEESLSGEDLIVARRGDSFYLRAAEFEDFAADESASVDVRATEIVRILNAAAKVRLGDHRAVSVGSTASAEQTLFFVNNFSHGSLQKRCATDPESSTNTSATR